MADIDTQKEEREDELVAMAVQAVEAEQAEEQRFGPSEAPADAHPVESESDHEEEGQALDDPFGDPSVAPPSQKGAHLLGRFVAAGMGEAVWRPFLDPQGVQVGDAEVLVAPETDEDYNRMLSELHRKYAKGKDGRLDRERLNWALPSIYSRSLWRGIRNFRLGPEGEQPVDVVEAGVLVETANKKITRSRREVRFDVDRDGFLVDSQQNRMRLGMVFPSSLDRVYEIARDQSNYLGLESPESELGKG